MSPGEPWQSGQPSRTPSRLRLLLLVSLLMAGLVLFFPGDSMGSVRRLVGLGPERVLPAPRIVDAGGVFAFAMTQPGSAEPVSWDPCEPIEYAVNRDGEPPGGHDLVESAIERVSAASGLAFEDVGDTTDRPATGRLAPFGARPVVIAWSDTREFPELGGPVAGLGGSSAERSVRGRHYLVTGGVALDTDAFTATAIATSPQTMEAVVMHEVAHVVGLAHVNEPMELMFESATGRVDFGVGDLEGLARLGSVPCR